MPMSLSRGAIVMLPSIARNQPGVHRARLTCRRIAISVAVLRPFEDLNPNTPTPHCDASAGSAPPRQVGISVNRAGVGTATRARNSGLAVCPQFCERPLKAKFAPDLYGAFSVKRLFWVCCQFFVRSGKAVLRPVAWRSGSRSARKGSRDRNASAAWRLAA